MRNICQLPALPVVALVLVIQSNVVAGIITFEDRVDFQNATTGITTVDFEDFGTGAAGLFNASVVERSGAVIRPASGTAAVAGPSHGGFQSPGSAYYLNHPSFTPPGSPAIVILDRPYSAIGLDLGILGVNAGSSNLSFDFGASVERTSSYGFFGVILDTPVSQFQITPSNGARIGLDNLSFGFVQESNPTPTDIVEYSASSTFAVANSGDGQATGSNLRSATVAEVGNLSGGSSADIRGFAEFDLTNTPQEASSASLSFILDSSRGLQGQTGAPFSFIAEPYVGNNGIDISDFQASVATSQEDRQATADMNLSGSVIRFTAVQTGDAYDGFVIKLVADFSVNPQQPQVAYDEANKELVFRVVPNATTVGDVVQALNADAQASQVFTAAVISGPSNAVVQIVSPVSTSGGVIDVPYDPLGPFSTNQTVGATYEIDITSIYNQFMAANTSSLGFRVRQANEQDNAVYGVVFDEFQLTVASQSSSVVPEPSSFAIYGVMLGIMCLARQRRRSVKQF